MTYTTTQDVSQAKKTTNQEREEMMLCTCGHNEFVHYPDHEQGGRTCVMCGCRQLVSAPSHNQPTKTAHAASEKLAETMAVTFKFGGDRQTFAEAIRRFCFDYVDKTQPDGKREKR